MPGAKPVEVLSDEDLKARIAEVLARWPLYRRLKFENDTLHDYPEIIRTHCPICSGDRNFDRFSWEGVKSTRRVQGPFGPEQVTSARGALRTLSYLCPDCKRHWVSYVIHWDQRLEGDVNVIQKCGQYPELETIIDPDLEKSIPKGDVVLLKKAITCRNFNDGLASVAYLRRVVENLRRVVENQIEPLIQRLLNIESDSEELKTRIEKARTDRGFRGLLDLAGKVLPEYLKPGGKNPLVPPHKLASEGVHELPEDECIEIFDQSKEVFSFVFRELRRHQREVKVFEENLKKLQKT